MSLITNFVVVWDACGPAADSVCEELQRLTGAAIFRVPESACCGNKAFASSAIIGALNYCPPRELAAKLQQVQSWNPERVLLLVSYDDDEEGQWSPLEWRDAPLSR